MRKTEEINRLKHLQKQLKSSQETKNKSSETKVAISSEVLRIAQKFVSGANSADMDQFKKAANQVVQQGKKGTKIISCIFKVNDDLRQDILALQVIKLFQHIFEEKGLNLYVMPYKCISNRTGANKELGGLIEVIPNSYSRD